MRVFGIDCGTEFTGYGVVEVDCDARMPRLVHLAAGTIRLNKKEKTPQRLAQVYAELTALITLHQPEISRHRRSFLLGECEVCAEAWPGAWRSDAGRSNLWAAGGRVCPALHQKLGGWLRIGRKRASAVHGQTSARTTKTPSIRRMLRMRWRLRSVTSIRRRRSNFRARVDEGNCKHCFWHGTLCYVLASCTRGSNV